MGFDPYSQLSACNERNREHLLDLLALIRHMVTSDYHQQEVCESCRRFGVIGASTEEWPWRNYSSDEPRPADPEYLTATPQDELRQEGGER